MSSPDTSPQRNRLPVPYSTPSRPASEATPQSPSSVKFKAQANFARLSAAVHGAMPKTLDFSGVGTGKTTRLVPPAARRKLDDIEENASPPSKSDSDADRESASRKSESRNVSPIAEQNIKQASQKTSNLDAMDVEERRRRDDERNKRKREGTADGETENVSAATSPSPKKKQTMETKESCNAADSPKHHASQPTENVASSSSAADNRTITPPVPETSDHPFKIPHATPSIHDFKLGGATPRMMSTTASPMVGRVFGDGTQASGFKDIKSTTFGDAGNSSSTTSFQDLLKSAGTGKTVRNKSGENQAGDADAEAGDGDDAAAAEAEAESTAEFKPVVNLEKIDNILSGEEEEDLLQSTRAKLYYSDPVSREWKERGVGNLKVLQRRDDPTKLRLLMRQENMHKLILNMPIASCKIEQDEKVIRIRGLDYSISNDAVEPGTFSLRTANKGEAKKICDAFEAPE